MKKPVQFGKYHLLDRINVGGMAEVFRAKAFGVEGFERLLAVKRILPNIAEDKEFIEMFIDEAKLAVQLSHANICQIFDLGKVDTFYFIALEYVHGKDLRALFDRAKQRPEGGAVTMPLAQACFVVMKMCEGLDYAHNKKDAQGRELHLVHRDVSPQNVIVSYDGEVKLIDFGIAKSVGKASKTQAGILKGKFGYMSPEQVRGLPLDRRSDVFSVGIVLYELLTGERLFTGESDFSTLEKVRNVEILPPSTYNRKIPDELERIVMKALSKDVDDRYQNAIDLHDDLQAFMYTAGEFYSRKDLAVYMKRQWKKEIDEETSKLESFRSLTPPIVAESGDKNPGQSPRATRPASPPPPAALDVVSSAPPPARVTSPQVPGARAGMFASAAGAPGARGAHASAARAELEWDEEELETHVYENAKDASDAVVEEHVDEISARHLVEANGKSNHGIKLDDFDLSPDGAPVFSKVQPAQPEPLAPPPRAPSLAPAPLPPAPVSIAPVPVSPSGRSFEPAAPRMQDLGGLPPLAPMTTAISPMGRRAPRRSSVPLYLGLGAALLLIAVLGGVLLLGSRPGELQISTDPPLAGGNVRVLLDNKPAQPDSSGRIKVDPGTYQVAVEAEGYVPSRVSVEVKGGEVVKRRIDLEPFAKAGFTLVSEPPGASAFLDGKDLGGRTPFKVEGLPSGKHRVELSLNGANWSQDIVLEPGKIIDVRATLTSPATPPPVAIAPPPVAPAAPPAGPTLSPMTAIEAPPPPRRNRNVEPPAPRQRAPRPRPASGGEVGLPKPPEPAAEEKPAVEKPAVAEKPAKPAGGAEGFLRLGSKPWTQITVDGRDTGLHTPQLNLRLPPGPHKVTLTNPQFQIKESFSVEIKAGETETVIKDLRPQGGAE